jgi:hypothetical protein
MTWKCVASGDIATHILISSTRWRQVISCKPWPLYPQERSASTYQIGVWVGSWAGLDLMVKRKVPTVAALHKSWVLGHCDTFLDGTFKFIPIILTWRVKADRQNNFYIPFIDRQNNVFIPFIYLSPSLVFLLLHSHTFYFINTILPPFCLK